MDVFKVNSKKARLADRRVRIVLDHDARAPWASRDLVFNPLYDEVYEKPLYEVDPSKVIAKRKTNILSLAFYTTKERIEELCGTDPKFQTEEAIEKLCWEPERKEIEEWFNDANFGIVVESWDPDNCDWTIDKSFYGMTGVESVLDNVKDTIKYRGESLCVVCCDEEAERFFEQSGMLKEEE